MGQSKFPQRLAECRLRVYDKLCYDYLIAEADHPLAPWVAAKPSNALDDYCHLCLLLEYPRHYKGQQRRKHLGDKAGCLAAVILYPHDPEVLQPVRSRFSPEAATAYIPQLQAVGRELLRKEWTAIATFEGMGNTPLQYWSSREFAEEALGKAEASRLAVKDAVVFAKQARMIA